MTTIHNSYCVPKTEAEWGMFPDRSLWCRNDDAVFGNIDFENQKRKGKTKIPASRFLDLLNDKICPWRLEEVGFVKRNNSHRLEVGDCSVDWVWSHNFAMVMGPRGFSDFKGITTFTDLLTLIRILTPASNAH